jgi:hypothetical protein
VLPCGHSAWCPKHAAEQLTFRFSASHRLQTANTPVLSPDRSSF